MCFMNSYKLLCLHQKKTRGNSPKLKSNGEKQGLIVFSLQVQRGKRPSIQKNDQGEIEHTFPECNITKLKCKAITLSFKTKHNLLFLFDICSIEHLYSKQTSFAHVENLSRQVLPCFLVISTSVGRNAQAAMTSHLLPGGANSTGPRAHETSVT